MLFCQCNLHKLSWKAESMWAERVETSAKVAMIMLCNHWQWNCADLQITNYTNTEQAKEDDENDFGDSPFHISPDTRRKA